MAGILIIDEENISVNGTRYAIERTFPNIQLHVSKTCSSGLDEVSKNDYQLIILDMMLPLGDLTVSAERADNLYGINVLEDIRKNKPKLPVVCYTIISDDNLKAQVEKLDAKYICKLQQNARPELLGYIKSQLNSK